LFGSIDETASGGGEMVESGASEVLNTGVPFHTAAPIVLCHVIFLSFPSTDCLRMSSDTPVEHILVIPASVIDSIGVIDGFESDVDRFLKPILSSEHLSFEPRDKMEVDPNFKQLIPYVLLEWTNKEGRLCLFNYTRGGGSGERRLHAKRSVGIGGHISREDAAEGADPYQTGMQRELDEEVTIGATYQSERLGLIYDPSNEVGRVHLGIVHRFVLSSPDVRSNEADLAEGKFVPVTELLSEPEGLETWSRLAIEAIYG
jgi:predicted NUDIX family phosphoesterase